MRGTRYARPSSRNVIIGLHMVTETDSRFTLSHENKTDYPNGGDSEGQQEMRFERVVIMLTLISLAFTNGCCLFGDGQTRSGVRGRLLYDNGEPVPNEKIQFLVPAFYWKSCLIGDDPMYRTTVIYTGKDGSFSHIFEPKIFPATTCFIPPMRFPSYPSKPNFAAFLPDRAGHGVVTEFHGKKIRSQTVQLEAGILTISEQSSECEQIKMTGAICKSKFPFPDYPEWKVQGWWAEVDITIRGD